MKVVEKTSLASVKARCFLMAVFLVPWRVVVQAVSSGRGCRNLAGGPDVRVAAASAHHDPGF
jgi:hypothetical protein